MTCGAHAHQGSQMQPNAHALVHSVHRAHRAGGTLSASAAQTHKSAEARPRFTQELAPMVAARFAGFPAAAVVLNRQHSWS